MRTWKPCASSRLRCQSSLAMQSSEFPVDAATLSRHAEIPSSFLVTSVYEIQQIRRGLGGWTLTEVPVTVPWVKDYDAHGGPLRWLKHGWDLSNWVLSGAANQGRYVGGALVAWKTPQAFSLEARDDLAAVWDIRVHPDAQRVGVGRLLFSHAATWARAKGCKRLTVETQNINVRACKFYAAQGCELRAIHPDFYPDCPGEHQFRWYLDR